MFSDAWSENAALFERLMEIHSNPPILYYMYGFNPCPTPNENPNRHYNSLLCITIITGATVAGANVRSPRVEARGKVQTV